MLRSRDEGQQIGTITTRTIRRIGYIGPQGTVRPNSGGASAGVSAGPSFPFMTPGLASYDYDALCAEASVEFQQSDMPVMLSRALASTHGDGAPVVGDWEWTPPFEMTHNRPERFSPQQLRTYGKLENLCTVCQDPLDLWEYSERHSAASGEGFYNAMYHCRNWSFSRPSRPSYFAGFFRFSGGRGPGLYINDDGVMRPGDDDLGIVGHLLRQANQYAGRPQIGNHTVRTNVVYHAAPHDILTSISRTVFRASLNTLGVHGQGTYFAMGPFVDYCMGNSMSGLNYAIHNGGSDGFVYVMVCHAVTRPSLNTYNAPNKFKNGFTDADNFNKYVSAGTCGNEPDLLSNKKDREVVYGDHNIGRVVYPIGIAAFKHR